MIEKDNTISIEIVERESDASAGLSTKLNLFNYLAVQALLRVSR